MISPSLLAADFLNIQKEIQAMEKAGVSMIHLDVMDGHFVPGITFGADFIQSIRKITDLQLDVHLMIDNIDEKLTDYIEAGSDIISVHVEATKHLDRIINQIKDKKIKACVALNPATSLNTIEHIIHKLDMILLLGVNPGYGGQKLLPYMVKKIESLKDMLESQGLDIPIQLDGGVNQSTIGLLRTAGVDIFVAGSAVFNTYDTIKNNLDCLKMKTNLDM